MNKQIEIIQKTRQYILDQVNDLTPAQLNKIPPGFNNNIAWNLAHLTASLQGLCYTRAGMPTYADEAFVKKYEPGTRPLEDINATQLETIKRWHLAVIGQLETDYHNNLFVNYTTWTNRYGIKISTIDEVIAYIIFHEGLHVGIILAMKRLVNT